MVLYDLLIIPILFGLIGFIEPCSLGINIIFLNRVNQFTRAKRIYETVIFTFVRGFFLAIGSRFITIQFSLFIVLGAIYILLGILSIVNMYHPIFKTDINLGKFVKNKGAVALGVIFGLIIPACAIAFVIALIGKALVAGNLFQGFISLFVFGITLSSPLIVISYFKKSNEIVQKIAAKAKSVPWLAGVILIIVGILTMLTSVWWAGALG